MKQITACNYDGIAADSSIEETDVAQADAPLLLSLDSVDASPDYSELVLTAAPSQPVADREISVSVRLFDLALGSAILLFVMPLMALCALAVILSSRGAVIYRQVRLGRGGREFTCFKFRTMIEASEHALSGLLVEGSAHRDEWAAIYKLRDDPRVTFIGQFMRRYSLDELPQLFNVLKGDMSIVGPRPVVADEIQRYGRHFADYCSVNPGITGLWQVSGRHSLSYDERVRLDVDYARRKSLLLDLVILWKTVPVVFLGQNE